MKHGISVGIDATQQWSNYWRQGHLTSLPCGFSANYDGEFLRFWTSQFAPLRPGSCVLDVCSGNGSIALLAQDYSDRHGLALDIKAVDAADIDASALIEKKPAFERQIQAIEFIPNTLFEDLPAEAASVDLVTSQYGIEYTDWELSADKIFHVLKPGGCFSMVCHDFDSKIMTQMEVQQRDYTRLLSIDLFAQEIEPQDARTDPEKFVKQLASALDTIYAMFNQDRTSEVFSAVGPELEKIGRETLNDFNSGLKRFSRFAQGIKISYATSSDLLAVNRRLQQSPDWFEVFVDKGLVLAQTEYIHYRTKERAGKYYQFSKPG
jgi:ubiquinone/menaquinone biosynthesis C-methylase UbiE